MRPDDPRHGTENGYGNLGCRCEACTVAHRVYTREWTHRSGRRIPRELRKVMHRDKRAAEPCGTNSKYVWGCRCDECRKAANAYKCERRTRYVVKTHGYSGYVRGCRCDVCVDAQRAYKRERYAKRKQLA